MLPLSLSLPVPQLPCSRYTGLRWWLCAGCYDGAGGTVNSTMARFLMIGLG